MTAERIRLLTEEWRKSGEYDMPLELQKLLHGQEHGPIGGAIHEDYIVGAGDFHVHVARQCGACLPSKDAHYECVVVRSTGGERRRLNPSPILEGQGTRQGVCSALRHMEGPVLVDVREMSQDGKGVSSRVIDSVVRLQSFDQCKSLTVNAPVDIDAPRFTLLREPIVVYRKLGVLGGRASIGEDELPRQIVKCRAKVMEGIPEYQREAAWWFSEHWDLNYKGYSIRLLVHDGRPAFSIQVPPHSIIQTLDVLFCATELR